jgi:hypothetical protein
MATLTVQAVVDGAVRDVSADQLRLTLPNGVVIEVSPDHPDRHGSLVLSIPASLERATVDEFVVRPGASNLMRINAERHERAPRPPGTVTVSA